MENKLLKKFIQFAFGNGVVLILGFLSSPIITRLILPEEMGKYSMFNTICNLVFLVVTLGLDQAYVRYFYEEEEKDRKVLLNNSIKICIAIDIALSVILFTFYKSISRFIVGEESITVVIFMAIFIFFNVISRFSLLVIRMKQKAKLYSLIQIIEKASYITLVLINYVIFKNSYLTLIISLTLSNIILVIVSIIKEKEEWKFTNTKREIKTTKKELINYGTPLIFSMAIIWIFQSIDRVTLNIYSNYNEIGLYSAATSIISLLNAFKNTFTTFWVPVANEKYVNDPNNKEFFVDINKLVSYVMLILGILLIGFKDLVVLLLGSRYRDAVYIFPFLVFVPIMYTISETTVMGIGFKKKNSYHIWIALVSAIVNLIGNFIMVPAYGAKGAAISTGMAYIVFFAMRTYFSNKIYKIDFKLKRFYLSTTMLSIFALYSTMNSIDILSVSMTFISLILVSVLYRDIILVYVNKLIANMKKCNYLGFFD